jgi:hypothetical protein
MSFNNMLVDKTLRRLNLTPGHVTSILSSLLEIAPSRGSLSQRWRAPRTETAPPSPERGPAPSKSAPLLESGAPEIYFFLCRFILSDGGWIKNLSFVMSC